MLSEIQQKDVWEGWLGAEIRANYFAELSVYYQTQQKALTWLTLVFSSGAAVTLLTGWLPADLQWVKAALALLAAAVSLFSLVQQNQKRTTDSADLHLRWSKLGNEYKTLWDDMYSPDAFDRLRALENIEAELSKSGLTLPNNERAMARWQDYVLGQHNLTPVS